MPPLLHLAGFFLLSIGAQLPPNVIVGIKGIAIDEVGVVEKFIDGDSITTYLEGSTNSLPTIYGSMFDTCDPKEKKVELVESTMRDDKKYNFTLVKGKLKVHGKPSESVKLCLGENNKPGLNWIIVKEAPVNWSLIGWAIVIVLSTLLSALFTGLNIGLMSLTLEQLEAYKNHGTGKKKKYAEDILPFRRDSNLLICSLTIANALVNILNALGFGYIFGEVAISVCWFNDLLDEFLFWNVYSEYALSVFCPALLTLILGEILPQAVCSKYPLQTGSWTKNVTRALLLVLYPVAKPVSFLLTLVSGKEAREVYSKEMLAKLLKAHAKNTDDVSKLDQGDYIIRSMARTLENLGKQAKDVMVPWEKVKKLTANDVINDELWKKLSKMQYSRFPVIENGKDPKFNGLSLGIVSALWHKSYLFRTALEETPIITLLEEMKKGIPVMLVFRSNDESSFEIVGMLTLEDLLEQVIGEIKDEKENKNKNSND
ncbi:unnamed protein product, partial [Mesorhabditis belari]|uniref:CNNM transmembrane domain-containing protein n=1 Tax=Mesorhabditis belari TaxID=2138241 RepID=A0AAF3FC09_9BILA